MPGKKRIVGPRETWSRSQNTVILESAFIQIFDDFLYMTYRLYDSLVISRG
jgi:hypothetical protein